MKRLTPRLVTLLSLVALLIGSPAPAQTVSIQNQTIQARDDAVAAAAAAAAARTGAETARTGAETARTGAETARTGAEAANAAAQAAKATAEAIAASFQPPQKTIIPSPVGVSWTAPVGSVIVAIIVNGVRYEPEDTSLFTRSGTPTGRTLTATTAFSNFLTDAGLNLAGTGQLIFVWNNV